MYEHFVFLRVVLKNDVYDGAGIAAYARSTAPTSKEVCAGFVSDCLIAKGVKMKKQTGVGENYLYSELLRVGFKHHDITRSGNFICASGGNNALIEVGDVVIFKCLSCTTKQLPWKHAGIVTKIGSDKKVYITHVNTWDDVKKTYTYKIDDVMAGTFSGCTHSYTKTALFLMKYGK